MNTRRDFFKLAGAAMVSVTGIASASENPFGLTKMDSGYTQVADNHMEGTGGSEKPMKAAEGSCGGMKAPKEMEGNCGGMNAPKEMKEKGGNNKMEGGCGANMPEGKCGSKS